VFVDVNGLLFDTVCILERVHATLGVIVEKAELEILDAGLAVHGERVRELYKVFDAV